ncbi:MAG: PKD domain-containing protein [Verrucomicrobia bacterium]|nr:PKD domain-containing protein [Verrucomicrobiota bacterium]
MKTINSKRKVISNNNGPSRCGLWLRQWIWLLLLVASITLASAVDYVIVVDTSGSMRERVNAKDNRIRITVVQNALREYLPALPHPSRVCLIAFNTGIVSEREIELNDSTDLQKATTWVTDLDRLTRSDGQTHLWTTLRRALQVATHYSQENPSQPVVVRVLTDGQDNQGVTSLEKVLGQFPLVDGEHIRGNLVLLGDLELKTKLNVPEGAFTTTKSVAWEDLFPPVVLASPQEPRIGEQVRMFENTKAIYKDYEWSVDGTVVSRDKVLTSQFETPGVHSVVLKVNGLQGTRNSTTVLIRVKEQDRFDVGFLMTPSAPEPQQEVRLVARCSSRATKFAWLVNSNLVATNQDFVFRFEADGQYEVELTAWDATGRTGKQSQRVNVREKGVVVSIKGVNEVTAGHPVQLASEITGPCAGVEWDFGDGTTSREKNPLHTFTNSAADFSDFQVTLRGASPSGKVVQAAPHTVRVWAEKKAQPPRAAFRVLNQNLKAGDVLQLVDDSQGLVEAWKWEVIGEATSHDRNPAIQVKTAGHKIVQLEVNGPGGTAAVTNSIVVKPRYSAVATKASSNPQSGTAPLVVQLAGGISGDVRSVQWEFGDGQTSTNVSPSHTFTQATNYTVKLVAYPSDAAQPPVESRFVVSVRKPVPGWKKALPFMGCTILVAGIAALLARHKRQKALRLPVYVWPEDSSACRSLLLIRADEVRELTPDVPLRIKRIGKSNRVIVEAVSDAVILGSSGQELKTQDIAEGARIVIRSGSRAPRAVTISTVQKPGRPLPASGECEPFAESTQLHEATKNSEFDWGWETGSPAKHN